MNLINNWITKHKHAEKIAITIYIIGYILLIISSLLPHNWFVYFIIGTLCISIITVMWVGRIYLHSR